jgi:hypothetical protein
MAMKIEVRERLHRIPRRELRQVFAGLQPIDTQIIEASYLPPIVVPVPMSALPAVVAALTWESV